MTPEQEKAARRALGALGATRGPGAAGEVPSSPRATDPPLPADVAARLDAVLEDLAGPRRAAHDGDLAERRAAQERRRRHQRRQHLLVVAAAVVVIALGGGAVALRAVRGTQEGSGSAGSAADGGAVAASGTPGGAGTAFGTGPRSVVPPGAAGVAPRLRRDTLRADVDRLLSSPAAGAATGHLVGCVPPRSAAGERLLGVRLDGHRAVLAVAADGRRARVFSCATGRTVVASTSLTP